jgi:predicted patatin/cPLA2 family phospholipase
MFIMGIAVERNDLPLEMQAMGPYKIVLENVYRRSQGNGRPDVRTGLVLVGGMQRGVIQAWQCAGLETLGYTADGFDVVVGNSVGATVGREFVGGNVQKSKHYFAEETPGRIVTPRRNIQFIDFVEGMKLLQEKGASEEAVKSAKTDLYFALRNTRTGQCGFMNAREVDDTRAAVISSMSMWGITRRGNVLVNGESYNDPMHVNALPLQYITKTLGATDVLVMFTEYPFKTSSRALWAINTLISGLANLKHPQEILAFPKHTRINQQNLDFLQQPPEGVRIAAFYPSNMPLVPDERNVELIRTAGEEAEAFARKIGTEVKEQLLVAV